MQKNHTATQSSFANPCSAAPGGFDSGLYVYLHFLSPLLESDSFSYSVPVSDNNTNGPFPAGTVPQVADTSTSVWVYCRQTGHCQKGMVFAINPGAKFAAFQAAAMGNTTTNSSSSSSASPAASTTASSSSPSSTSNDHRVIVGGATLTFEPSNITAQPGDTITFEFHQKNHTVTQSSFANPCQMLSANSTSGQVGFDSGLYVLFLSFFFFMQRTCRSHRTIWLACLPVQTPPRSLRTPCR